MQSLLAEIERDRPMIRLVHERVFAPRLNVFGLILARGAERGEIPPGAVSPLVADLGPAMLVQRSWATPRRYQTSSSWRSWTT